MENEKTCRDCKHYRRHYVDIEGRYHEIHDGHWRLSPGQAQAGRGSALRTLHPAGAGAIIDITKAPLALSARGPHYERHSADPVRVIPACTAVTAGRPGAVRDGVFGGQALHLDEGIAAGQVQTALLVDLGDLDQHLGRPRGPRPPPSRPA